ncbi:hypothetical protein [Desulfonema magnum]|uniref:Uncharacterized protein n=1 Tax=Desulfonema magnum TaxID=45655 RepID=A0A975BN07_9BACT|nr:hypothetical protein [Desulfonema magnum]QTA88508.1 Uncharacterized protein dnm_045540 [Desulfonema magnum]
MNIKEIDEQIQLMISTADELKRLGQDFPALYRNMVRIRASLKMLELNVSNITELTEEETQNAV